MEFADYRIAFQRSTAGELLARQTPAPIDVLASMQAAIEAHAE
jgi:hypothetical protein